VSDAVAVQVMVVPITCGDTGDGVMDRIRTVAEAGTDNAASIPIRHKESVLGIFMKF
jgi:DNA repair photolyase